MSLVTEQSMKEEVEEVFENKILQEGVKKMWDGSIFKVQVMIKDPSIKYYLEGDQEVYIIKFTKEG